MLEIYYSRSWCSLNKPCANYRLSREDLFLDSNDTWSGSMRCCVIYSLSEHAALSNYFTSGGFKELRDKKKKIEWMCV